LNCTIK